MRITSMRAARSIFSGLIILSAFVSGQTAPQPDPIALLQRVRTRLLADAGRMPRYTCLQNITRHFYRTNSTEPQSCAAILAKRAQRKHDPPPTSWDRLQLDVAIADDREIHSWPDAPRFNEEEIRKLVSNGPFGSGDFSAFVAGIFGGGSTIKFEGAHAVNGRTLFEYTFAVTNNASRYQIATAGATLITAYDGSFLLDPQSADLAQLSVRTAELPEATNACQAISEIEYGRIDIHGRQVMIPDQTDLRIVYRDGREAVATTSYSSCHEYTSKAILRFDAEPVAVSASAHPAITAAATQPSSPFPADSPSIAELLRRLIPTRPPDARLKPSYVRRFAGKTKPFWRLEARASADAWCGWRIIRARSIISKSGCAWNPSKGTEPSCRCTPLWRINRHRR